MLMPKQIPEKLRLSALIGHSAGAALSETARVLDRRGFIVHQARSSNEVLRIANLRRVDFLLIDSDLPEIGGLGTYHLLKEMVRFLPCILVAYQPTSEMRRRALDEETFSLIPKPVEPTVLWDSVNRLVKRYFPDLRDNLM